MSLRNLYLLVLVGLGAVMASCGGGGSASPGTLGNPGGGGHAAMSRHIVLVVEENHSYDSVVGNTSAWPNLNNLVSQGALATKYYANTHPSIGNYFMLTTGQVLTNDDSSTRVWDVDNLARRMIQAGVSFKVYAEGITQGYTGGNTGLYVIRHNPFAMLSDVAGTPSAADQYLWPFSQFAADAAANALPQFSFIVPNIVHDAHTGTGRPADAWLQARVVAPLSSASTFKSGGDGVLIVDFDESVTSDTANGGGHVPCVFWGPVVRSGYKQSSQAVYQHASMLATIMSSLSLSNPPGAAASAPVMSELFVQ